MLVLVFSGNWCGWALFQVVRLVGFVGWGLVGSSVWGLAVGGIFLWVGII